MMPFLFLSCYSFPSTFANIFSTPLEPHWPPPRTLYLSCSLPPWGCSARTFWGSMCVLSLEVILFGGSPSWSAWEHYICSYNTANREENPLKAHSVLLKVAKGKKQGENARQSGLLNICHFVPHICILQFYQENSASVSSTARPASSAFFSNSLTQSPDPMTVSKWPEKREFKSIEAEFQAL